MAGVSCRIARARERRGMRSLRFGLKWQHAEIVPEIREIAAFPDFRRAADPLYRGRSTVEYRPFRPRLAIGVAGLGEIGPIAEHQFLQRQVILAPRARLAPQMAIGKADFRAMPGLAAISAGLI